MKKKMLSIILSAILVGIIIPVLPAINESADNQGIWYNPTNPDASGTAKRTTVLHSKPNKLSIALGIITKGTLLDELERTVDSNGVEWVRVKKHDGSNNVSGYIKANDFSVRVY